MKTIILYIIILISLLGCSEDNWKETYFPNGNLMVRTQLDKNSIPNGLHEEFYESGELKLSTIIMAGKLMDTAKIYSKDGFLKEKGLMWNGLKTSWWSEYDEIGHKYSEKEFFIKNKDTIVENQTKRYNNKGEIDYKSSWFFDIKVNKIINQDVFEGEIVYHSNFNLEDQLLYAVINRDTFYGKNNRIPFGFQIERSDTINLSGEIFEEVLAIKNINDTLSSLEQTTYQKYFNETYKITDSVVSIESFSKTKTL